MDLSSFYGKRDGRYNAINSRMPKQMEQVARLRPFISYTHVKCVVSNLVGQLII